MVTGVALGMLALFTAAHVAEARNYHCAGGVQYVIQGKKEQDKGNTEDARRIYNKAVRELSICTKEDPKDAEAWGYLGQAYAELDSAEQAGAAFNEAISRLQNEPKTLARIKDNRDYYWKDYYNKGIAKFNDARGIMDPAEIPNSKDPKADEAKAKLAEASTYMRKSLAIDPKQSPTWNNLAVYLALQGKFDEATAAVNEGLSHLPSDEGLKTRKDGMYSNAVTDKIKAEDYEGALSLLDAAVQRNPKDFNALTRAADVSFQWGQKLDQAKDDAGKKAKFALAQDYFSRAATVAPDDSSKRDSRYNAAVAASAAGDAKAAAHIVFDLVQDHPKEIQLHQMLRGNYDRMGSSKKASDEIWVILGMNEKSKPVDDVKAYIAGVTAGSAAAKTAAEHGEPEEVRQFSSEGTSVDIWYYWSKKRVFAFSKYQLAGQANFGEFGPEDGDAAAPAAGSKAPAKKPSAKTATSGSKS
ncbi:MAG: tetratricopeptide repeat protein [Candidatus Eiseniibacteriota bacterium]